MKILTWLMGTVAFIVLLILLIVFISRNTREAAETVKINDSLKELTTLNQQTQSLLNELLVELRKSKEEKPAESPMHQQPPQTPKNTQPPCCGCEIKTE